MATAVATTKPRLRGWLHLGTAPVALVVGLVLTASGTTYADRLAIAVFTLTSCLLFATSAVYHVGSWPPTVTAALGKLDHANIALIIAGTYTPIAVAILPHHQAVVLLWVVWLAALAIVASSLSGFVISWRAPRWLSTSMYLILGWAAVLWLPTLWHDAGVLNFALIALGGILYSMGGVVYALRRPKLSPRIFGFHELFHTFTVAAFACHVLVIARVAC